MAKKKKKPPNQGKTTKIQVTVPGLQMRERTGFHESKSIIPDGPEGPEKSQIVVTGGAGAKPAKKRFERGGRALATLDQGKVRPYPLPGATLVAVRWVKKNFSSRNPVERAEGEGTQTGSENGGAMSGSSFGGSSQGARACI